MWEVVVVDNTSDDDSAARARAWYRHLPRLQVVTTAECARPSASFARNTGAAAANSDLLLFCDADDVVGAGWIAGLVNVAARADMVTGTYEFELLNDRRTVARNGWRPAADELTVAFGFLGQALGGNCAIWRPVLEAVGGWNERYRAFGDIELAWRVQLAGYDLRFAHDALVHARVRPSLGAIWRRALRDAEVEVQLFADFRARGMPRTNTARAVRTWGGRLVHLPDLAGPVRRAAYVRQTGAVIGRAVGSVRRRTRYL
jgi:glycosyltransferase involved in cell wall biosynthesis